MLATAFAYQAKASTCDHARGATQAANEPERIRAVAGRQRAGVRFVKVRAVGDEEIALLVGHRIRARRVHVDREIREEPNMAGAGGVSLALVLELSLRVLPDGFEHPVTVLTCLIAPMPDQALVEQRLE